MEKAIQESKKLSKKLNTNEEAGPSNYPNLVVTSDHPSYVDVSDSDKESHYRYGVEDQISHCRKI
jgi:hypothetical protein